MVESSPATGIVNNPMMTTYHVSTSWHFDNTGALVNNATSGGIARADCHVIEATDHFVNIEGIDNQVMEKHPVVRTEHCVASIIKLA